MQMERIPAGSFLCGNELRAGAETTLCARRGSMSDRKGPKDGGQQAAVGFIGLGAMGLPMALNVAAKAEGRQLVVYDISEEAMCEAERAGAVRAASPRELGDRCDAVVSMLPNDAVLESVCCDSETGLLASSFCGIHVGCSTVHPDTSRSLSELHDRKSSGERSCVYVGAPVFARADGVAQRQATIVVGGPQAAVRSVTWMLEAMAMRVVSFGEDPGAGNVVKLCGNFMIAAAIESCAEACSLAEKSGVDRTAMMELMSSSIFDCLIYRGYGMRVAHRQHIVGQPLVGPGFDLELGTKDVALTRRLASEVTAPMPFCSLLHDRFVASSNRFRRRSQHDGSDADGEGRDGTKTAGFADGRLDWSAIGLLASEEAGIDVSGWLPGGVLAAEPGDSTAPTK